MASKIFAPTKSRSRRQAAAPACLRERLFEFGAGGGRQQAAAGERAAELGNDVECAVILSLRGFQRRAVGVRHAHEPGTHFFLLLQRARHEQGKAYEGQEKNAQNR
jgi:hypothetical protein